MQSLTATEIRSALEEMGRDLARAGKTVDIALYGGAAIMLQFDVEFRTTDVDVRVESGDHGAVERAAANVAHRRGWLRSWFSEAVTVYLSSEADTSFHASYPSSGPAGLRVYVAKPDYLLAMKLRGMRVGSRDETDATLLARATGITTFEGMMSLLKAYFPKEPPDSRRMVLIGQFAETLHASPP